MPAMGPLAALKKNAPAIVGLLFVAGMVWATYTGIITKDGVQELLEKQRGYFSDSGPTGMVLFIAVDVALIVACQPGSFAMEMFAGYVYGLYVGVGLIVAAKMLAAAVCYVLGKYLFAAWVSSMLKKNKIFATLKKKSGSDGFMFVLSLRLSPLPSYICSYGPSVMNVPFRAFMQATALCTAPMVILNVNVGASAKSFADVFTSGGGGMAEYVKLALPFVGTLLLCWWLKSILSAAVSGKKTAAPRKPAPGSNYEPGEGWVRRSSRPVVPSEKVAEAKGIKKTPSKASPRKKTPSKASPRSPSPPATRRMSARGKSPSRKK